MLYAGARCGGTAPPQGAQSARGSFSHSLTPDSSGEKFFSHTCEDKSPCNLLAPYSSFSAMLLSRARGEQQNQPVSNFYLLHKRQINSLGRYSSTPFVAGAQLPEANNLPRTELDEPSSMSRNVSP